MSDPKVTSVTVSGHLHPFKQGQVLDDRPTIALYYRMSVNEGRDAPADITDETILAIIDEESIPEGMEPDDIDVVRTEAIEKYLLHPAVAETANA